MDPKIYGNNADEILPRLWLGNRNAALDETFIRTNAIEVVFNCTKDIPFSTLIPKQYRIPVDDNLQEEEIRNMSLWSMEIAYKLLFHYKEGHRILVHCAAGMQRSAAATAIFLIAKKGHTTDEAIQFIRSKRRVAFLPSANFYKSIKFFEGKFHDEILPAINQTIRKQREELGLE